MISAMRLAVAPPISVTTVTAQHCTRVESDREFETFAVVATRCIYKWSLVWKRAWSSVVLFAHSEYAPCFL